MSNRPGFDTYCLSRNPSCYRRGVVAATTPRPKACLPCKRRLYKGFGGRVRNGRTGCQQDARTGSASCDRTRRASESLTPNCEMPASSSDLPTPNPHWPSSLRCRAATDPLNWITCTCASHPEAGSWELEDRRWGEEVSGVSNTLARWGGGGEWDGSVTRTGGETNGG